MLAWSHLFPHLLLKAMINEKDRRLELVKSHVVPAEAAGTGSKSNKAKRKAQLHEHFNRAIERGEEGLVVKDMTSPYLLGETGRRKGVHKCAHST